MSSLSSKQGPRYRHLAGETEPYETIGVEKLTPIIGAEISGVDIGKLVSDDARSNSQMDEIHRALAENLVIFFRDQHITPMQHLAFGQKFGELQGSFDVVFSSAVGSFAAFGFSRPALFFLGQQGGERSCQQGSRDVTVRLLQDRKSVV